MFPRRQSLLIAMNPNEINFSVSSSVKIIHEHIEAVLLIVSYSEKDNIVVNKNLHS
jgi:hypothetical protein